jgi:hypothetical protein
VLSSLKRKTADGKQLLHDTPGYTVRERLVLVRRMIEKFDITDADMKDMQESSAVEFGHFCRFVRTESEREKMGDLEWFRMRFRKNYEDAIPDAR